MSKYLDRCKEVITSISAVLEQSTGLRAKHADLVEQAKSDPKVVQVIISGTNILTSLPDQLRGIALEEILIILGNAFEQSSIEDEKMVRETVKLMVE